MHILERAHSLVKAGYSVLPIRTDGTKKPALKTWAPYQQRIATAGELRQWFEPGKNGIAVVCGAISGNLLVFDFDRPDVLRPWAKLVQASHPGLLLRCPLVKTPQGWHVYLRACEGPRHGEVLARNERGDTLIETRGEGQYVLTAGCPGACHPSGAIYSLAKWEEVL